MIIGIRNDTEVHSISEDFVRRYCGFQIDLFQFQDISPLCIPMRIRGLRFIRYARIFCQHKFSEQAPRCNRIHEVLRIIPNNSLGCHLFIFLVRLSGRDHHFEAFPVRGEMLTIRYTVLIGPLRNRDIQLIVRVKVTCINCERCTEVAVLPASSRSFDTYEIITGRKNISGIIRLELNKELIVLCFLEQIDGRRVFIGV